MNIKETALQETLRVRVSHMQSLYFLHIPKTAGTSFRVWLSRYFHARATLMIDHLSELETTSDETLFKHRFFSGHFGWHMMERAINAGIACEPLTIFREPLATILSSLRYAKRLTDDELLPLYEGRRHFLTELLEQMTNVSKLDSTVQENIASEIFLNSNIRNMVTRFLARNGTEDPIQLPIEQTDFERAKSRIESMGFFGIVEDWERTAILFAKTYGVPLKPMASRFNETIARDTDLDFKKFAALIEKGNHYDFELYRFAKDLLERRLLEIRSEFNLKADAPFDAFEAPLLERFLNTERGVTKLYNASVPIADDFFQSGFEHRYEYDSDWIIWASQLKSSIFLPLDSTKHLELRFRLEIILSDKIRTELKVSVGGIERGVNLVYVQSQTNKGQYHVELSVSVPLGSIPDAQYTAIDFFVPELIGVKDGVFDANLAFALTGDIIVSEIKHESHLTKLAS